ncbi:uncharacterized protein LOC114343874 isoform X2 [Diabrotica virgifera virgifera]|uniref:CAP-Gly domain-containing protein n=1 Tax=Diabrotica virgifera virgifera TaxID=50390 RepID=A0ABM5JR93_DIAVI|nr:uncharacterized protein LOC114343874 isoform X2 [Diabrotica virgifera virgifera]
MSSAPKTGLSRIPTFGSRIPHAESKPVVVSATGTISTDSEITAKNIGNRVRVGDKEGILRFVGEVKFSKGVWCGIELSTSAGKNDGFVNGIRYFACPDRRGLMAPLAKVSLVNANCETIENASGPYSMLFINARQGRNHELERAVSHEELVQERIAKKFNISRHETTKKLHQNLNNTTTIDKKCLQQTTNLIIPKPIEINKKRSNDTIDSPKSESAALESENKNRKNEDIPKYFPIDKACENLLKDSSSEVKRRRTSNPKIQKLDALVLRSLNENIDKPSSLPQLKCSRSSIDSFGIGIYNSSTSEQTDGDTTLKILRLSGGKQDLNATTNFEDDSSKRDSLEFDESLGILTPDEMCSQFLNSQIRSPSLEEYDKNINDFFSSTNSNRKLDIDSPRDDSLGLIEEKLINLSMSKTKPLNLDVPQVKDNKEDVQSPNLTDYSLGIIDEQVFGNLTMKTNTVNMELPLDVEKSTLNRMEQTPSPEELPLDPTNLTEYSLGVIDEHVLSNLTMKTDTTVNMELPLDAEKSALTRMEQTPSPEELPLDPTPIVECDPKTEPSKSKTSNSFINSITSITSLDTGYQGDGEMSRPASRGADNSPLTRRPLPRPQCRRVDPMTDSDFYTESDADNHEENHLRGDRRVQIIDGTLYGIDPQAAADIYVNNRENMDSSGIFTDIETNTRNEDDFIRMEVPDVSPSDTSSKTISENSQDNIQQIIEKSAEKKAEQAISKDNPKKRNAPSPGISSPSSFSSPRHGAKDDSAAKKYKMPKREVVSKVKAMIDPPNEQNNEKKTVKKPAGRWDAVMSKISKNEQNKTNLKEVKSKVFNAVNNNTAVPQRKAVTRSPGSQKNPNSKLIIPTKSSAISQFSRSTSAAALQNGQKSTNIKLNGNSSVSPVALKRPSRASTAVNMVERRRIRNRPNSGPSPKTIAGINLESSIHSSLSDVSAATLPPTNKPIGSAKKRADVVQVTQVLTANKLPARAQQNTAAENKKNATLHSSPTTDPKTRRTIFSSKDKKPSTIKECTRGTIKGGRTSPTVRPPATIRVPQVKQPPVAEALAVLVQHLVFNVQAYQVPNLKRQVEKLRIESDEIKLAYQQLEEALSQEKLQHSRAIEDERKRYQSDATLIIEKHRHEVSELNQHYAELEQQILSEKENTHQALCKQHEEQLSTVKKEFDKLQRTHEESLDILREENDSIREQIDEKQMEIDRIKHESKKLKDDYETKETVLKEHNHKLKQQLNKIEGDFEERLKGLVEENKRLREENDRLLSYGDDKGISVQEVQSLRVVLELKQNEVTDLRKSLAEANQRAELLEGAEERARVLNARCEDLQLQLERKADSEKCLVQENRKLHDSFKEENNQNRRLSQRIEEFQWKLKQNTEVLNKVMERAEESVFNRSLISSSFNEKHSSTRLSLERAMSFRERSYSRRYSNNGDDLIDRKSPPTSPKVKSMVEKSDSVSYVLEMDESPEVVASRIVRGSFRNTTPSKNTPTKSPSNKRPRIRNPLSQSSSSGAIISTNRNELDRPRSANSRNGDSDNDSVFMWSPNIKYDEHQDESYESSNSSMKLEDHDHLDLDEDNDDDLPLPALPSELDRRNGAQALLPSPKHLAGEAMISESNSEDESTSSSQL